MDRLDLAAIQSMSVSALHEELTARAGRMQELAAQAGADGDVTPEMAEEAKALNTELEALAAARDAKAAALAAFARAEALLQAQTEPRRPMVFPGAGGGDGNATPAKGLVVAQLVRALAAAKGDPERAAAWAKRHDAHPETLKALGAGDATAGGFIVPPSYSADIIELLRAQAVVRRLNPVTLPMPNGTLTVPKLTGGATASYTGENRDAAASEQTFGDLNLVYKKLTALVPISNDLIRFSSPQADDVVRQDLVSAMALREDLAFIRDTGAQHTPRGLRHWAPAAHLVAANATVNLANVTSDLGKLVLKLEEANVRMLRPGWLMAPRTKQYLATVRDANGNFAYRDEIMAGRLWGFPFGVTNQIPTNLGAGSDESEVYLVDFADAVIGEATEIVLDASAEAAYHDGASVVAAFSRDQTVIRAIARHDFGMRHDQSVAVLTGVQWTP